MAKSSQEGKIGVKGGVLCLQERLTEVDLKDDQERTNRSTLERNNHVEMLQVEKWRYDLQ